MGSKKKDLEIIYNLQWKNKPTNGDDKANIIGMYDIPATTLNWEVFKSYLLKNSGTVGDNVKISYITDSNREFPIESQTDFQIALYAFRRKARMGDIVNLKMWICDHPTYKNIRHSNDVETQFDNEAASLVSTCCNIDAPPDWFITYMDQFKKNITEEVTSTVSGIVSNIKPHTLSQSSCYHGRKSKPECPKRIRKHSALLGEPSHDTKDVIKSLKLEGKLERKLEKLEHKTKKIKEKKLALLSKSSDSEAGPSSRKSHSPIPSENGDDSLLMDVTPVNNQAPSHMSGGEDIVHQWVVMNTGKLPWTNKTSLKYTWGSKALTPLDSKIPIPHLKPGETASIGVRLKVPNFAGNYECYYHFHHDGRRFGHWLGCQIIVDACRYAPNKVGERSQFLLDPFYDNAKFGIGEPRTKFQQDVSEILYGSSRMYYPYNIFERDCPDEEPESEVKVEDDEASAKNVLDELVRDISARADNLKLQEPTDTNCSSDSDNQSILSVSDSESSKSLPEEFVVVPIPDCFKVDPIPDASNENAQVDCKIIESCTVNEATAGSSKTESVENVAPNPEQIPDNYDDNNNTERTNQNPTVSVASSRADDDVSCDGSQKSDIVIISLPKEDDEINAGYAYVIIDGNKMQIPKKILKSEYLMTAEGTPSPNVSRTSSVASSVEIVKEDELTKQDYNPLQPESVTPTPFTEPQADSASTSESNVGADSNYELLSHCSAAGSTFSEVNSAAEKNSRLFIFPQNCAGYEVVYPILDLEEDIRPTSPLFGIPGPVIAQPATSASSPPLNLSTHDRNPFIGSPIDHVPNYQQTPPNMRTPSEPRVDSTENVTAPTAEPVANAPAPETVRISQNSTPIHILPETLVSGAVSVASSAFNTARSVINMMTPREQPGRWVNGHWISTNAETPREGNLQALAEMGFWNRDLNATLLARYNDDLSRVVAELVQ